MGEKDGIVDNYKCLGVHLNGRLDWKTKTDAVYEGNEQTQIFQCC